MNVAVVHDYITQRGGAERVVLSMMHAFPGASLHTSLFDPAGTFPEFTDLGPHTLPLNRLAVFRRHHRWALPLLAPAFSRYEVDADVVLCSSSGWAHGVRTEGRKVVYCYSPARWLYQTQRYVDGRPLSATAAGALKRPLVAWDKRAAATADRYLTLSTVVQARIKDLYEVHAEVLPPPPTIDPGGPRRPVSGLDAGFHLCVSRLLAYKNVDAVVEAFASLPGERLVVVGAGPERRRLQSAAGPNVSFLGAVGDDELRWLYGACSAVIAASYEDYGLTPLEAACFGLPAAVLRWGGFLDTLVENETGVFFDQPVPDDIADAVRRLGHQAWSADVLRAHADRFSQHRFERRLQEIVHHVFTVG